MMLSYAGENGISGDGEDNKIKPPVIWWEWCRKPNSKSKEAVQTDNRSLSHTRWKCQYHIVFIPKYRKRILYGRLREDVKEIISTLCKYRKVDIIAGAVCKDHVHLSVAIPPKESISDFMGYLKGKSTLMIYDRHPELQSKWDKREMEY